MTQWNLYKPFHGHAQLILIGGSLKSLAFLATMETEKSYLLHITHILILSTCVMNIVIDTSG